MAPDPLAPSDLSPLPGGMSGETFVGSVAGERVVVRIYAGRSQSRGPGAAEHDAQVLDWVGGLLPVPRVLEVRRGAPEQDQPALLVTSFLPGVLLQDVLDDLDDDRLRRAGRSLGTVLGRLAGVVLPRTGAFGDDLSIEPFPAELDLQELVEAHAADLGWPEPDLAALREVAARAAAIGDQEPLACLVHADLNPKNVLVDPETLAVTGVLDWEFAHAGSPYADLGNLLRFNRRPAFVEAVLEARAALAPSHADDALDRARAADLVALVDLAGRAGAEPDNPVAARAARRLRTIARTGDLHAS